MKTNAIKNNGLTGNQYKAFKNEYDYTDYGFDISDDLMERISIAAEDYVDEKTCELYDRGWANLGIMQYWNSDETARTEGVVDYLNNADKELFYKFKFNNDFTLMDLMHNILMEQVENKMWDMFGDRIENTEPVSCGYHLVA